jgi:hypothetical protein
MKIDEQGGVDTEAEGGEKEHVDEAGKEDEEKEEEEEEKEKNNVEW